MFFVQIAGHLGKDPEARFTPSGQKVTSFNIAINHRKGKEDVTTWVRVTVWGDRLDKIMPYLKKGSGVIVMGKMNPPTTYVDKEGKTQIALEIVAEMIEFNPFGKSDRAEGQGQGQGASTGAQAQEYGSSFEEPAYSANYKANSQNMASSTGQGMSNSGMNENDDTLPF